MIYSIQVKRAGWLRNLAGHWRHDILVQFLFDYFNLIYLIQMKRVGWLRNLTAPVAQWHAGPIEKNKQQKNNWAAVGQNVGQESCKYIQKDSPCMTWRYISKVGLFKIQQDNLVFCSANFLHQFEILIIRDLGRKTKGGLIVQRACPKEGGVS